MRKQSAQLFQEIQQEICLTLEAIDGSGKFQRDAWTRPDISGSAGGGGDTRVITNGAVIEKGGVNFSEVEGTLPREMSRKLTERDEELPFYATGISLVIHPHSPVVPTVHANYRYLEVADQKWFGGGSDLTPYILFEEDAVHFHSVLRDVCDQFDPEYYPRFKAWCDEYFYLPHRGEARGVGGVFYDYLGKEDPTQLDQLYSFQVAMSQSFLDCYVPIVERRKGEAWNDEQKNFQLLRRGRYVEFNLLYDRGTLFGLKTGGRIESILMSLPPEVHWEYDREPENAEERSLLDVLHSPRDWLQTAQQVSNG